ncbi:MAG: protein kinase [Polyangiaceae bacterium]
MTSFGPRFEVRRQLGEGGFGAVFEVLDRQRGELVALKSLLRLDPVSLLRFKREFRLFAEIEHPNLVRLHELFAHEERWFFTMELLRGRNWLEDVRPSLLSGPSVAFDPTVQASLTPDSAGGGVSDRHLKAAPELVAAPDWGRIRAALRALASALSAIHARGIVHRDVKPQNVLVTDEGRLVLLDFGIAMEADKTKGGGLTHQDSLIGTPVYMAPEQLSGDEVTAAADWYAVGTMLFEACSGQLPFSGTVMALFHQKTSRDAPAVESVAPDVPADLASLCNQLLSRDVRGRATGDDILLCAEHAPAVAPLAVPRDEPAFIGRERYLDELRARFELCGKSGKPKVVVLEGPSGIGKTSLARTFLSALPPEVLKLEGRCLQSESVPFKALDQIIDQLSRYLSGRPAEETASLLHRHAHLLGRLFPALMHVSAIASAPVTALGDQALRATATAALRELVVRLCDRKRLVLLIDDAQWGDADSGWLVAELLGSAEPPPILLVLTRRPNEPESGVFMNALTRHASELGASLDVEFLDVEPLSETEVQAFAEGFSDNIVHIPIADLARATGGNPFLVGELLRHGGDASFADIRDLVSQRVEALAPPVRRILEMVAVAERSVNVEVVQHANDSSAAETRNALTVLNSAHLVRLVGARGEFVQSYHDRIREAVLGEIPKATRQSLHQKLGRALETFAETPAETVYRHYREGGLSAEALAWGRRAADAATRTLAFDRASHLLSELLELDAMEPTERRELQLARADALLKAKRFEAGVQACLELAGSGPVSERMALQRTAAETLLYMGQVERGRQALEPILAHYKIWWPRQSAVRLVALLVMVVLVRVRIWRATSGARKPTAPSERVRLLLAIGAIQFSVDPPTGAFLVFSAALSGDAKRADTSLAISRSFLVTLRFTGEAFKKRKSSVREALEALEEVDEMVSGMELEPTERGWLVANRGLCMSLGGQWQPTVHMVDSYLQNMGPREEPPPMLKGLILTWALTAAIRLGQFRGAAQYASEIHRVAADHGLVALGALVQDCILTYLAQGQAEEARAQIESAQAKWLRAVGHVDVQYHNMDLALLLVDLYVGNLEQASESGRRLARRVQQPSMRFFRGIPFVTNWFASQASLQAWSRRPTDSVLERQTCRQIAFARNNGTLKDMPACTTVEAGIAFVRGQREVAIETLERALGEALEFELGGLAACIRYKLGQVTGDEDRFREADAWLAKNGVLDPPRFASLIVPGFDGGLEPPSRGR